MLKGFRSFAGIAIAFVFLLLGPCFGARPLLAQASGTIEGTVKDPSGGAIASAIVQISNPLSKYERTAPTDSEGKFRFANLPYNPYHISVKADGFSDFSQDADVRSLVTVSINISMSLAGANTTVTVEGDSDLLEKDSTFHTDVDRGLFERMPLESASSSVSSLVTLVSPGIAADSNGNMVAKRRLFAPVGPGLKQIREGADGKIYVLASPFPGLVVYSPEARRLLTMREPSSRRRSQEYATSLPCRVRRVAWGSRPWRSTWQSPCSGAERKWRCWTRTSMDRRRL